MRVSNRSAGLVLLIGALAMSGCGVADQQPVILQDRPNHGISGSFILTFHAELVQAPASLEIHGDPAPRELTELVWRDWGSGTPAATGTMILPAQPESGGPIRRRVEVVASRPVPTTAGQVYSALTITADAAGDGVPPEVRVLPHPTPRPGRR